MSSKVIKQERIAPEVDSARSKLNGALQFLIDKNEESSSSSSDSSKGSPDAQIKAEAAQAKKLYRKHQRKRKRIEEQNIKNSYVMKLFDRSVDLAQFSEDTPLYPVCRAWIRNKPFSNLPVVRSRSPTPSPEEDSDELETGREGKGKAIFKLPQPLPTEKDLRIPSDLPKDTGHEELDALTSSDMPPAISTENLLAKHMTRWRLVRQKWKEAAKSNEARYKESTDVLKNLFEQSGNKEDGPSHEIWNGNQNSDQ